MKKVEDSPTVQYKEKSEANKREKEGNGWIKREWPKMKAE